jgi:predicted phosphodiesterase
MEKIVLILSDQHIPYNHPEMLDFLKAVKQKYKPTRIVNIGDELDHHNMAVSHDSDPDLPNAGDEHKIALKTIKQLENLFPKMDLVHSNHGSMAYRRAFASGIPKAYIKDYNDFLEVGKGWKWHEDLILDTPTGKVYFCHGKVANITKLVQQYGMSCVQGHYHSQFKIEYVSRPDALTWGLQVGCLVDKDSLAMAYGRIFKDRPIIGCGIIIDGLPKLLPMRLTKGGSWDKVVP